MRHNRLAVLGVIAAATGGLVMVLRFLDPWTEPEARQLPLPFHRKAAVTVALPFRMLEWNVADLVHSYGRKTPADPDVVVLGIDEASLVLENSSAFPEDIEESRPLQLMDQRFPWSREVWAALLGQLAEAGAETVVMDMMFGAPYKDHLEGDARFREALDSYRDHVILAADVFEVSTPNGIVDGFQVPDDGLVPHQLPVDPRVGFATYFPKDYPEGDGVIRKAAYRRSPDPRLQEKTVYSMAAATLRSQGRGDRVPEGFGEHRVRFGDAADYAPVSLHELFVPAIWESNYAAGEVFRGKTVFLGSVARQQQDFHTTPVGRIAGVRIHAHVYAATKAGELLRELPAAVPPLLVAAAAALGWLLVAFCGRPLLAVGLLFGGIGLALVGQLALFNHAGLVVDASTPSLAFGLVGLVGLGYEFVLERRQRNALKRAVMRFHSPDVAEEIVERPETYYSIRAGAERTIVVLFSDIRGYTSMSEVLSAKEMVVQLNEYFEEMVTAVFDEQGAVDKFIGDALMAVWGRFRDNPAEADLVEDSRRAVRAALVMRKALAELNARWHQQGITELAIGIGIHQGDAVVGEIGSHERTELTAIGDSVNLSSRLEGATKEYGLDLLVSEPVQRRIADAFTCRTADLVRVKGKTKPVEVFAVIAARSEPRPAGLDDYEAAMADYRAGRFEEATRGFSRAAAAGLDDKLTQVFAERSAALAKSPPDHWDGVFTMTKK